MSASEQGRATGLEWTIERQHALVTIYLRGELDLGSAPNLERIVQDAVAASPVTVIDLADLEFMDSTGLRLFAETHRTARAAGARLLLGRPSHAVLRVLQVAGLVEHFDYAEGAPPRDRICPVCEEWLATPGKRCPHCGSCI